MRSSNGLLTTVAYKMGPEADVHYALEVRNFVTKIFKNPKNSVFLSSGFCSNGWTVC